MFESGGAQAIAAMAYGTETVPKVDKLCGPGNSFVTMAKMLVQNDSSASVSIDMPAGPSEVMVCKHTNNITYSCSNRCSACIAGLRLMRMRIMMTIIIIVVIIMLSVNVVYISKLNKV